MSSRMVAASAALTISGIPFMGPIGAARVGYINGEYVLNPLIDTYPESKLDLVVAGTHDAVMMVESEAKELAEEVMLGAVMFGHKADADGNRRASSGWRKRPPRIRAPCRKMCMRPFAPSSKAAASAELASRVPDRRQA